MLDRLSLRARLLLGVFLLAAIGLVAADAATYASLRSFLLDRVDKTLEAGHAQVEHIAFPQPSARGGGQGPNGRQGPGGNGPPAEGIDWYQVRLLDGTVVRSGFLVGGGSAPKLPDEIQLPASTAVPNGERTAYFTVSSADGSTSYRVRASVEPQQPNRVYIIATKLGDVFSTLHRLLVIELVVTLGVLAAIAGLGLWVIRLGLRPLREIEGTAAAIAAGDLSRRVERAEPRTEVGRLGLSLNAMLAQIESAFKAREASENRLRRFVADASHELRTPLAAVRAYAELFSRGAASRPDDLARSMSGISRETERMSLLVDDLLLLARLDEGRPLEQERVELDRVVGEAVDAARVVDAGRPVSLDVEPATVIGDHDRLRQVVDNLFANVRAHTPPGTPVAVDLRRVDGRAELSVSDSGPGLTENEAGQVFERFYRVDTSRTRSSGGVGLGLSIVAAVAEAHGGTASAHPTPGGGATFVIEIPLANGVEGARAGSP
ncbi:MAG TPA: HAMP domain-containing sensor histidine kinase [Gaiellaceae bacterium]|nr:HAMP domain-containing sensor histidine kinase [Gaiellaceae bacterium]